MSVDSSAVYSRSPQADATLAGDRAAIYHRESRKAITLNSVGTIIWQALETPRSVAELQAVLQARFPQVDALVLATDLDRFLADLFGHDLLEQSAG